MTAMGLLPVTARAAPRNFVAVRRFRRGWREEAPGMTTAGLPPETGYAASRVHDAVRSARAASAVSFTKGRLS
ncbi:hypothetical protein ACGFY9_41195 [Streptomyces sp. NPDC048504]|uniref:hypothetical protein n=1 Tax=Streptomyces sp. NPDC048504 TaxID=3365559 RepID=UPI003712215C